MKDILSLPDNVLVHILSFLSTKEAINTSVVSKEWQKIVRSLPSLRFDYDSSNSKRKRKVDDYNFMNFVDEVLFNHKGGIEKFSINCGDSVDPNRIRRWIKYAMANGVRELDLRLSHNFDSFPLRVFTCETLEVLQIHSVIRSSKIPANICLRNLKTLSLLFLPGDDYTPIQRLISSCTMLEELEIHGLTLNQNCSFSVPTLKRLTIGFINGKFHIDAPNLSYFKCEFFRQNVCVKNMNNLLEAEINFGPCRIVNDYDRATIDLFKAISHVKSLHISGLFEEVLIVGRLLSKLSELTHLSLKGQCYKGWKRWISVLPQSFPNVEALDLNVKDSVTKAKEADIPPPCSWPQLRKINVLSFENTESELQIIEYLLNNAVSLEKLTVRNKERRNWRPANLRLMKLTKASNKCKIIVM